MLACFIGKELARAVERAKSYRVGYFASVRVAKISKI